MTNDLSAGVEPVGRTGRDVDIERTLEALREDAEVAHVLLGFSSALAEVRTVEATLEMAVRMVPEILGCDRAFVVALDRTTNWLHVMHSVGYTEEEAKAVQHLSGSPEAFPLLRWSLRERKPVIVENAQEDPRITREEAESRCLGAFIRIPLIRREEEFGGLGIEYRNPHVFTAKEESLARGIGRQLGVALANARQFNLLSSLSNFGLRLATRFRLQQVGEEVARGAADLLGGDGACLYLMETARRSMLPAATFGRTPPEQFARILIDEEPWSSLVEGRTVMVSQSGDHPQDEYEPVAIVGVPAMGAGMELVGAIVVFFGRRIAIGPDEKVALNVLASQSVLAIENAQRFERQRSVARSLQRGLLSTETPALLGCEIAAVYEPASSESDVGGDFYDVFELREHVYGLVVGDVSGKGAEAAALTAQAKYMLRAFASRNRKPASVLFHLNNALAASLTDDRFATLVYAVYDARKSRCQISSAGHPSPLLFRSATASVSAIETPGILLGAFPDQQFEQASFEFGLGDVLLAYTDGLIDARSGDGRLFSRERLERSLERLAPAMGQADLARAIYDEATAFGRVTDDTVVFTLARSDS